MDGTCGTNRRNKVHSKILSENLKEGDHLEDLGEDGRVILKLI
jgi:hypothetical protein